MLPLGYSWQMTKHGGHPSEMWDSSDSFAWGLAIGWVGTFLVLHYSIKLFLPNPPSFLLRSSQWEARAEDWRMGEGENLGPSPSLSAFCGSFSNMCLCHLHVFISLRIIYPLPLWCGLLWAAPTEPLAPSSSHCNKMISVGLGTGKFTSSLYSRREFQKRSSFCKN